jgi:hypothetical protein
VGWVDQPLAKLTRRGRVLASYVQVFLHVAVPHGSDVRAKHTGPRDEGGVHETSRLNMHVCDSTNPEQDPIN